MNAVYDGQLLDVSDTSAVEVLIRKDKKVVWVNVDGVCVLRVCNIPDLEVNDT